VIDFGDVVGLIFAIFFAFLVVALIVVLLKLTKVLAETQKLVSGITDKTVPLLGEVTGTVSHVNDELVRVDAITAACSPPRSAARSSRSRPSPTASAGRPASATRPTSPRGSRPT